MPLFTLTRDVRLSPQEAWDRVTNWPRHADFVPLTTIRKAEGGFVARTGIGILGFDDPMEIVEWRPPRHCRLEKRGSVVLGWAELTVEPLGELSRVTWKEEIRVRGVPRIFDPLTRAAGIRLFGRVLDGLLERSP